MMKNTYSENQKNILKFEQKFHVLMAFMLHEEEIVFPIKIIR